MKADPSKQLRLLDLQALDTRLAQLAHARRTLPVHTELADLSGTIRALDDELVRARTALDDVQREVAKAEADVQLVRDRAARDQARLDSGVGTSKDLMSLQHELGSLARRQAELEDVELEVMERAEALENDVTQLSTARSEVAQKVADLTEQRDEAVARLDAEAATVGAPRADLVASIGPELLALYDKIVGQSGTGAAMLQARRCLGCQLELNAVEIGQIRAAAPDDVVRCGECNRILVRTPESGL